jgi:ferrous iron transport protein B
VRSIVLGALYETGWIWYLSRPLSPIVVGWLGLPAAAGLTLIFAILRKELALQLLLVLAVAQFGAGVRSIANFMTPQQIVVYTTVNTIYVPCVATIAMLNRELGWRRAAVICLGTIAAAVLVGGLVARLLNLL